MLKSASSLVLASLVLVGWSGRASTARNFACALALLPVLSGCNDASRDGDSPRFFTTAEIREKICVQSNVCATIGNQLWYLDGGSIYTNIAPGTRADRGLDTVRALVGFKDWPVALQRRGGLKILGPDEHGEPRWYVIATGASDVSVDGDELVMTSANGKTLRFDAGPGVVHWSLKKIRSAGIEIAAKKRRVFENEYAPLLNGREIKFVGPTASIDKIN